MSRGFVGLARGSTRSADDEGTKPGAPRPRMTRSTVYSERTRACFSGQTKELSVFDLNISKLLILAVIALVIFGPNELPKMASQAGRALRDLRRIAEGAKNDLREGLGPEFADFDIEDLNRSEEHTSEL